MDMFSSAHVWGPMSIHSCVFMLHKERGNGKGGEAAGEERREEAVEVPETGPGTILLH